MTITTQQLIALSPMLCIGLTVAIVMLFIACRRNHILSATLTVIGLILALFFLRYIENYSDIVDVTPLLRMDSYSIFYSVLIIISSIVTCIFAYPWLCGFTKNKDEFYLLILISTLGGLVIACANHLATLFIGMELLSLPLFGLIGYCFYQKFSLEAALKYTILSTVASAFFLFGVGLIYLECGSMSFNHLINNGVIEPIFLIGTGMIIISFSFKLSLVPFHLWTPDVYQGAPAPVSIFLATATKIAVFSSMMRLFICSPIMYTEEVKTLISVIASLSILFGNLMAIWQNNIKRLLGYSSIVHIGYLLITLITIKTSNFSLEAAQVYLIAYLLSNFGSFGVVSLMSSPYQGSDADSLYLYRGLFWKRPILSSVITIMMLSFAGIPMTLGFIGKFYIIALGVNAHYWFLTSIVIIGSAISLYYYLRVIISLYLRPPKSSHKFNNLIHWQYTPPGILVLLSTILVLLLGVYPQLLIKWLHMFVQNK